MSIYAQSLLSILREITIGAHGKMLTRRVIIHRLGQAFSDDKLTYLYLLIYIRRVNTNNTIIGRMNRAKTFMEFVGMWRDLSPLFPAYPRCHWLSRSRPSLRLYESDPGSSIGMHQLYDITINACAAVHVGLATIIHALR